MNDKCCVCLTILECDLSYFTAEFVSFVLEGIEHTIGHYQCFLSRRFYDKAEEESLPAILKECMELFRSEAFFLLLSNFTGLKLHFLAPEEEEEEAAVGDPSSCSQGEISQEETEGHNGAGEPRGNSENNGCRNGMRSVLIQSLFFSVASLIVCPK